MERPLLQLATKALGAWWCIHGDKGFNTLWASAYSLQGQPSLPWWRDYKRGVKHLWDGFSLPTDVSGHIICVLCMHDLFCSASTAFSQSGIAQICNIQS